MIRLVRAASSTPNVSNRDDTCFVRYAYGGESGIVKNFAGELALSVVPYATRPEYIHLLGGRVVLMGWEVDIDEQDVSVPYGSGDAGVTFWLYLEIDLLVESVKLGWEKGGTLPGTMLDRYDWVYGDDFTQHPSGKARIYLYTIDSFVNPPTEPICKKLEYLKDKIQRMTVTFLSGKLTVASGVSQRENRLTRRANSVFGRLRVETSVVPLPFTATLPDNMLPSSAQEVTAFVFDAASQKYTSVDAWVHPDGTFEVLYQGSNTYQAIDVSLMYEAAPLL